jgi:hypothetical protein
MDMEVGELIVVSLIISQSIGSLRMGLKFRMLPVGIVA